MLYDFSVKQIRQLQDNCFRLLRLISQYLNERADFISAEMVREVASVGGIGEEEAFLLLFAEALGVHPTDDGEDASFFRDFLAPSVRCLDAEKYRNDPYYRTIRFPSVRNDRWEMRIDKLKPYQTFIWDDLRPDEMLRELPPLGYFKEPFDYPVVLEDGREWMLVTPNEVETIRPAVEAAHGRVVTFGLGLGYFPFMASLKAEVDRVVVVERDPRVIELFSRYLLPQFPCGEKIRLVCMDAFAYLDEVMEGERFDHAYADIWHDAGDGVPLYLRFNKYEERFPGTKFDYWIEETMLCYLRRYDFGRMPSDVRDPLRWLSNENVKRRAKDLTAEEWMRKDQTV